MTKQVVHKQYLVSDKEQLIRCQDRYDDLHNLIGYSVLSYAIFDFSKAEEVTSIHFYELFEDSLVIGYAIIKESENGICLPYENTPDPAWRFSIEEISIEKNKRQKGNGTYLLNYIKEDLCKLHDDPLIFVYSIARKATTFYIKNNGWLLDDNEGEQSAYLFITTKSICKAEYRSIISKSHWNRHIDFLPGYQLTLAIRGLPKDISVYDALAIMDIQHRYQYVRGESPGRRLREMQRQMGIQGKMQEQTITQN